ncbi:MAG: type I-U CRISPR-associated protein Cas7 [Chromatiaceae bacterium]|nr:MAG: type I-U CRISPR-associated protein Cas7 [Chromatiaceae bacterium]
MNFDALKDHPRLLIEAQLRPLQGSRFQPTGFPDLGAAEFDGPDGTRMLLVESPQSVANRLEAVCWENALDNWVAPLQGLPYVRVIDKDGINLTNSVLEAHRINSEYIAREEDFAPVAEAIGFLKDRSFDVRKQLVPALLRYDINSLLHGVFLEEIGGVIRLPRALSGFIEAWGISPVQSGGVKLNPVEPTLKEGEGNVPYSRIEYTAQSIIAFFNIDLAQIYGWGLSDGAAKLILALSLFKVQRFLKVGLRLRTACDLDLETLQVTRPHGYVLPTLEELQDTLPGLIEEVYAEVPTSARVTTVRWSGNRKGRKGKAGEKQGA